MLRNPLLVPDLRELMASGETGALSEFLADHHPGHVAEIIEDLGDELGDEALRLLPDRMRAEVMSYVEPDRQVSAIRVGLGFWFGVVSAWSEKSWERPHKRLKNQ